LRTGIGLFNTTYLHQAALELNPEGLAVQGKTNASQRTSAHVCGTHHEYRETFTVPRADHNDPEKYIDTNHMEDRIEISQA
jgi:hypothetical protein